MFLLKINPRKGISLEYSKLTVKMDTIAANGQILNKPLQCFRALLVWSQLYFIPKITTETTKDFILNGPKLALLVAKIFLCLTQIIRESSKLLDTLKYYLIVLIVFGHFQSKLEKHLKNYCVFEIIFLNGYKKRRNWFYCFVIVEGRA